MADTLKLHLPADARRTAQGFVLWFLGFRPFDLVAIFASLSIAPWAHDAAAP